MSIDSHILKLDEQIALFIVTILKLMESLSS